MKRRDVFLGAAGFCLSGCNGAQEKVPDSAKATKITIDKELLALEAKMGGMIGLSVISQKQTMDWRSDTRFGYCSTFKWVLAAAILKAVQDKKITLDQKVFFTQKDIFNPAPATRPALKQGFMTVEELCLATVSKSDNPAANLLTHLIGGLSGLKAFTTLLGDETMRFDRLEPHLNDVGMSDMRDTVTPKAMTTLLFSALEGPVLADRSKLYLKDWMRATTTGFERIRAAVPKGIDIGDKTGTSGDGLAHDVAFLYPKDGSPIYLSVFTRTQSEETSINNSAIRAVTALVMSRLKLGVL